MNKKTKVNVRSIFVFATLLLLMCAVNVCSVFADDAPIQYESSVKLEIGTGKTITLNKNNLSPDGISYQISSSDSKAYYLKDSSDYISFTPNVDCTITISTYSSSGSVKVNSDTEISCGKTGTINGTAGTSYTIKAGNIGSSNGVSSITFTPLTQTTTTESTTEATTATTTTEATTIAFKTVLNANDLETQTITSRKLLANDKFMAMPEISRADYYVSVLSSIRNDVSVGGVTTSFTKALNTIGAGDESQRSVMFRTPSGSTNGKLYVYATSGNGENNVLKLISSNGTQTHEIHNQDVREAVFDIAPATNYYITGSGSLNIYYIGSTIELETIPDYDSLISGYVGVRKYELSYNNGAVVSNSEGMIAKAKTGDKDTNNVTYITLDTSADSYVAFKMEANTELPCRFNVADASVQITVLGTGSIDGNKVMTIDSTYRTKTVALQSGSEDSIFVIRFTDTTKKSPARVKNITFYSASATSMVDIIPVDNGAVLVGQFNGDPSVYSNVGFCVGKSAENVVNINNSELATYIEADVLCNKVYIGEDIKYNNEDQTDIYYYAVLIKNMNVGDTLYAIGYTEVNGVKCKETTEVSKVQQYTRG